MSAHARTRVRIATRTITPAQRFHERSAAAATRKLERSSSCECGGARALAFSSPTLIIKKTTQRASAHQRSMSATLALGAATVDRKGRRAAVEATFCLRLRSRKAQDGDF